MSGCLFIDIKLYLSSIIDMVLVLIKLKFVVPKFCCIKFFSTIFCSPDNTLPSIMTKVLLIFSLGISTTRKRPQSWLKFLNHLKTIILQLQFVLENLCKILWCFVIYSLTNHHLRKGGNYSGTIYNLLKFEEIDSNREELLPEDVPDLISN